VNAISESSHPTRAGLEERAEVAGNDQADKDEPKQKEKKRPPRKPVGVFDSSAAPEL